MKTVRDWVQEHDRKSPDIICDELMANWPHMCVSIKNFKHDKFTHSNSWLLDTLIGLDEEIRSELGFDLEDYVVTADIPFDGRVVVATTKASDIVLVRMVTETDSNLEITGNWEGNNT